MDKDRDSKEARQRGENRARRRVDPREEEAHLAELAKERAARSLADQDETSSAAELSRLQSIGKKDGGSSPKEVTVRWVDGEDGK